MLGTVASTPGGTVGGSVIAAPSRRSRHRAYGTPSRPSIPPTVDQGSLIANRLPACRSRELSVAYGTLRAVVGPDTGGRQAWVSATASAERPSIALADSIVTGANWSPVRSRLGRSPVRSHR